MESQKSLIQHAKKISKKRKIAKVTEKAAILRLIFYKHQVWHAYCFIYGHGYQFFKITYEFRRNYGSKKTVSL